VDVNAESSPLPPANRDGRIDQDWAGDDQDWWDWYVTLAENDDAPIALVAGPGLPDVDPADDEQLRVELAAPTDLMLPSVKPSVVMPSSSWRIGGQEAEDRRDDAGGRPRFRGGDQGSSAGLAHAAARLCRRP
jgi:hypothetical protein